MPVLPQLPFWHGHLIPAGVVIAHVGTNASIPQHWSRVTALDGVLVKQIATNATNPGGTGGTTTHDHPYPQHATHTYSAHNHAGSWGTSATHTGQPLNGAATDQVNGMDNNFDHAHASSSVNAPAITTGNNASGQNTTTGSNDPNHVTTIFIQSNGVPDGIPVNGVLWFNGAAPTGFAAYAALDNRLMKGAAGGGDGGATVSPTHTHVSPSHNHTLTAGHTHVVALDGAGTNDLVNTENTAGPNGGHTHTLGTSGGPSVESTVDNNTETSGSGTFDPSWIKMRAIQKTSTIGIADSMIAMWTGTLATIPVNWKLCDGTNGTPNLSQALFTKAAATDGTVGNTGGATHTHAAGAGHTHASSTTHTHTLTTVSGNSTNPNTTYGQSATFAVVPQHTHGSTTYTSPASTVGTSTNIGNALAANNAADPSWTGIAYIMFTRT